MTSTRRTQRDRCLTPREREVLHEVASGLTNREIARRLFITVGSVQTHLRRIYPKLGALSKAHAVARGYDLGILLPRGRSSGPDSPEGR